MALVKPMVMGSDGFPQVIQSSDTLNATITPVSVRTITNGESSAAIVIGAPVYASAANTCKKAQANASGTSSVIGLGYDASIAAAATGSIITSGPLVATTTQWDAVAGTTGGLTFNTSYFLDPTTAGKITSTPPSTAGQYNVYVGTAISATELEVNIKTRILL